MKSNTINAAFIVAAILLTFVVGYPLLTQSAIADHDKNSTGSAGTQTASNSTQGNTTNVEVAAGSNATVQHYTFTPQSIEINAGESVTWSSSAELSDIHTVTFVLDQNLTSDLILPFKVPGQATASDFSVLPPFNAGQPLIMKMPDGTSAIAGINKDVFYPTVIDGSSQTTFLNGTDIRYTMNGTERALNSGIIQPPMLPMTPNATRTSAETNQSQAAMRESTMNDTASASQGTESMSPPFPIVGSFTVTFEKPGTYPYFCAVHPWMSGQVVVKGGNSTGTSSTTTEMQ